MRKHRTEVEEANLEDDEKAGDTIYIDSLPNSSIEIKQLHKVVVGHIEKYELMFFEEENSEDEERLRA